MKKTIQISVDLESWAELKSRNENISALCDRTIKAAAANKQEGNKSQKELEKEIESQSAKVAILKTQLQEQKEKNKPLTIEQEQIAARQAYAERLRKKRSCLNENQA